MTGGPGGGPFTAQDSSAASGGREWVGALEMRDCRWHCLCSPKFSQLHSWLGTGGWWWHYYTRGLVLSARFVFIFTVM